jgi:hypothetical protein
MRKAAEAIDDRLVRNCITRPFRIAQTRDQLDRMSLILAILTVLEWHVKKQPLRRCHTRIDPLADRGSGQAPRDGIGSERLRSAPEQVTGELIEYDHGGQQCAWRLCLAATVCNELLVQREEAAADPRIDAIALSKPILFAQLVKPEFQNRSHPGRFGWLAARMRVRHVAARQRSVWESGQTKGRSDMLGISRILERLLAHELRDREVLSHGQTRGYAHRIGRPCELRKGCAGAADDRKRGSVSIRRSRVVVSQPLQALTADLSGSISCATFSMSQERGVTGTSMMESTVRLLAACIERSQIALLCLRCGRLLTRCEGSGTTPSVGQ